MTQSHCPTTLMWVVFAGHRFHRRQAALPDHRGGGQQCGVCVPALQAEGVSPIPQRTRGGQGQGSEAGSQRQVSVSHTFQARGEGERFTHTSGQGQRLYDHINCVSILNVTRLVPECMCLRMCQKRCSHRHSTVLSDWARLKFGGRKCVHRLLCHACTVTLCGNVQSVDITSDAQCVVCAVSHMWTAEHTSTAMGVFQHRGLRHMLVFGCSP